MIALPADTTATGSLPPIESIAIERLLAQRDAAVAELHAVESATRRYTAVGEMIFAKEGDDHSQSWYAYRDPLNMRSSNGRVSDLESRDWLASATRAVDASIWDHLLRESGLWSFFDAQARDEWHKQIDERKCPPLTPENIAATFADLHAQRGSFFERGVIKVFRELSWEYKTNKPIAFGKKIIVTYLLDAYGFVNSRTADKLDDLTRAFCKLENKPEPDHRAGVSAILGAKHTRGEQTSFETEYYKIKVYKKGTGHIEFRRADLVDQMNLILARHYPGALAHAAGPSTEGEEENDAAR